MGQCEFTIKYSCRPRKVLAFFSGNFRDRSFAGEIAVKNLKVCRRFYRFFDWENDILLFEIERRNACKVLSNCLARNGHAIAVQVTFFQEILHYRRSEEHTSEL